MRKQRIAGRFCILFAALCLGISTQAAVAEDGVSRAYNEAVKLEDQLDGFDVTVKSVVSIAGQAAKAEKTVKIQANGLQTEGGLQAAVDVQTSDGEKQQYYKDGFFYSNQSGKDRKYAMNQETMVELLNYYVYLDFEAQYLSMLERRENGDGSATYSFAASQETVGAYGDKLLEGAQEEHRIDIVSLQGTVEVDPEGMIQERKIEMAYTVRRGDTPQLVSGMAFLIPFRWCAGSGPSLSGSTGRDCISPLIWRLT